MDRWYVVQTAARQELLAIGNIAAQGFPVFLPECYETQQRLQENKTTPLFPSYLFVQFDLQAVNWRSINGTRGVKRILSSTEDSAFPVPQGFVEALMQRGIINLFLPQHEEEFTKGDKVLVKGNAFNGLAGVVQNVAAKRVAILLALLSGEVTVILAKDQITHVTA